VAPELIQEGVNRMTTVALEAFLQMGSP
jgi:hypothetical protein